MLLNDTLEIIEDDKGIKGVDMDACNDNADVEHPITKKCNTHTSNMNTENLSIHQNSIFIYCLELYSRS